MQTLEIGADGRGVTTVALARPEKHNAMSGEMIAELAEAAGQLATDPETRVIILTGQGPTFCAGGDLQWMKDQMSAGTEERRQGALALARMLRAWNEMPVPVIARVQGNAFGGGIGLMSIADVAIGMSGAKFGLTETRLGLIPATIGPYVVARMGEARARRVFFSSRRFEAEEAKTLGLLAHVVVAEDLDAAVEAEVTPYLSCAPGAVAAAKRLTRQLGPVIDDAVIEMSVKALIAQWEGEEAPEGIAAFFEKRPASWVI